MTIYSGNGDDTNETNISVHEKSKSIEKVTGHDHILLFCHMCNFATKHRGSLRVHIASIHDKIKFKCDQCEYMATKLGNLKRHQQVLHGDEELSCDYCEYKTKQEYLDKHKQSQHGGKIFL